MAEKELAPVRSRYYYRGHTILLRSGTVYEVWRGVKLTTAGSIPGAEHLIDSWLDGS